MGKGETGALPQATASNTGKSWEPRMATGKLQLQGHGNQSHEIGPSASLAVWHRDL